MKALTSGMGVVVERGGVGGGRMFAARQKFRNDPLDSPIQKRIEILVALF